MVMSTETKDINRNGKKSTTTSPLISSNHSIKPPSDDLTPETSEDEENSKCEEVKNHLMFYNLFFFSSYL